MAGGRIPENEADFATPREMMSRASGGMPRYLQLGGVFKGLIASGQWPRDSQIPTIDELAEEFGVAPGTVSRALGILEAERLIERFRAKGTFVTGTPNAKLWCDVHAEWSDLLRPREGAAIDLIAEQRDQHPAMPFHGQGELAPSYRLLKRRHSRNDVPFYMVDLFIAEASYVKIPPATVANNTALGIIAKAKSIEIADVRQTLTVGLADLRAADMLDIPINAAVVHVQRSVIDAAGVLVMIANGTYRGDQVRFDLKLK